MRRGRIPKTKVFITKTLDRAGGIKSLIKQVTSPTVFKGKKVALKANYNSADDFPASTHIDTLTSIARFLKEEVKVDSLVLAERSGMGQTREVLENRGVFDLSKKLGFQVVILDHLGEEGWQKIQPGNSHWKRGFLFAKPFLETDKVVQTCCLKVHRFGGQITMSLKNSVGMVAKYDPKDNYQYMTELHTSRYQRLMIAEINLAYRPDLVIMDGIKAFKSDGPEEGEVVEPGLLIAGTDRVAIDAVGVAVLRKYGTTREVAKGKILELEQLARASELGIGISSVDGIELISINEESEKAAKEIREKLYST